MYGNSGVSECGIRGIKYRFFHRNQVALSLCLCNGIRIFVEVLEKVPSQGGEQFVVLILGCEEVLSAIVETRRWERATDVLLHN